jgi:ABC-type Fe3+/spermidine/putrescine transport system ATPase subunit
LPPPGTERCSAKANPDALRLEGVGLSYGGPTVLDRLDLALPAGKFLALLGPSGCGKTTLLRLVGGYLKPTVGRIFLHGRDVTELPPERRDVGMVFQNYALFPHLSARRNVAFGLEVRGTPRSERQQRVETMLDRVGLGPAERDRRPAALSGGQQQRVALARALVIEPTLLLLDEPLANLDRSLRDQMAGELRALQRRTGVTTLMATHDQEEALALADLVGVLAAGRLLQVGPPEEVYLRPRCPFVARALGPANLIRRSESGASASPALMLIRPERCLLGPEAHLCPVRWTGRVLEVTFRGQAWLLRLAIESQEVLLISRPAAAGPPPAVGECLPVGVSSDALWPLPEADPPGLEEASP